MKLIDAETILDIAKIQRDHLIEDLVDAQKRVEQAREYVRIAKDEDRRAKTAK